MVTRFLILFAVLFSGGLGLCQSYNPCSGKLCGVVYGSVNNTIKRANYRALKGACEAGGNVMILDTLQILFYESDTIKLTERVNIVGSGSQVSCIDIYPKEKQYSGVRVLFFQDEEADFGIENISVYGYANRWKHETYVATLRPGGDVDAVQVSGARAGFWTDLQNGDTILIQNDSATQGTYTTVTSFVSGTGIIQTATTFTTANNYTSATTFLGRNWDDDASQDDIDDYSKSWNTVNLETTFFYDARQRNTRFFTVEFKKVDISGVDTNINCEGINAKVVVSDCKMQANAINIAWFGASISYVSELVMDGTEMYDCGTELNGTITNGSIVTNATYGGGVYMHNGIVPFVDNCYFHNNSATTFRNFSGSNSIYKYGRKGVFLNSTWDENNEPYLLTSATFPSFIQNCQFRFNSYNGEYWGIRVGNSVAFENCTIQTSVMTDATGVPPDCDTCRYSISFNNCTFDEPAAFSHTGWTDGSQMLKSDVVFNSCTFYGNFDLGGEISVAVGNVNIKDCRVKYRNLGTTPGTSTTALRFKNKKSNLFQTIFAFGSTSVLQDKRVNVIIDNLQCDSILSGVLIMSADTLNPHMTLRLKNSVLKQTAIGELNTGIIDVYNSNFFTDSLNSLVRIHSLPQGVKAKTIASKVIYNYPFDADSVSFSNVLDLDSVDTYVVSGAELKGLHILRPNPAWDLTKPNKDWIGVTHKFRGRITLIATSTLKIIPFSRDNNSNIVANDTITMLSGEARELQYLPMPLGASESLDSITIATANGTRKDYNNLAGTFLSSPYVTGNSKVTVNGVAVTNADEDGRMIGANCMGIVNNLTGAYGIRFKTAPTTGHAIRLVFKKVTSPIHPGRWVVK